MKTIDQIPDDEMSLVKSEITELEKIWRYFLKLATIPEIRRMANGPNKLPVFINLQTRRRLEKYRKTFL